MIDETKLFEKIDSKQFELDYNNSFNNGIFEVEKKISLLKWVLEG